MHLLFDLDGTLTDPQEGCVKSLNYALAKFGLPTRDPASLVQFIGPSLNVAFRVLLETEDAATLAQAVVWFRERYFVEGWLENVVYAGIPALLPACRDAGHQLWVATSKRQDIAERVLTHFGLLPHFTAVYGCEVEVPKTALLAILLREQGLTPEQCVMIGDRRYDVEAGRANGITTIGVLWGYGAREELIAAGADHLIATPADLLPLVHHLSVSEMTAR